MKITNSSVDRIPYTAKGQKYYPDDTLKGFGVVVGRTTKTYVAQRDINRKTCRGVVTGKSMPAANQYRRARN